MPFINDRLRDQSVAQGEVDHAAGLEAPDQEGFALAAAGRVNAERIRAQLESRIFGQPLAVDSVYRTMQVIQAGLVDRERPLASHLFVGPTGTGKTEIVRQLAATLRSGPDDFCRVDMSALAQEHYAASFAGAPPGYAGSKEGHSVFRRDQVEGELGKPGIVLFDEVEKAHQTVVRALLHVLDHGVLHLANGEQRFNFRNCIVFLTSNLGSREIRDLQQSRPRRWARRHVENASSHLPESARQWLRQRLEGRIHEITQDALEKYFDPEFLNRVDEVTVFSELSQDVALRIAQAELDLVVGRAQTKGVDILLGPEVVRHVAQMGFDASYGGRSIRREVRHTVWPIVARHVITQRLRRLDIPQCQSTVRLSLSAPDRRGQRHVIAAEESTHPLPRNTTTAPGTPGAGPENRKEEESS